MRRRIPIASIALFLLLLVPIQSTARAQEEGFRGIIRGQLFTAQDPESVAAGAEVTLIFRKPGASVPERIPAHAGQDGTYLFAPVSTDPAIAYVVMVHYFGRDYLGAPMSFQQGSALLEFNFLVSRDAAPIPQTDAHPPMDGSLDGHLHPPLLPVRQDPVAAAIIVLGVLTLFALPFLLARAGDEPGRIEGSAADLMRDIASLDLRFADGDLDEPEYRAVRERLFAKLEERTGVSRPAARRAR
jgi:hypothetical protein